MVPAVKSNDPCWCGSGKKFKRCHKLSTDRVRGGRVTPMRTVPPEIPRPPYADTGEVVRRDEPLVKSPETIAAMREAGRIAAEILALVGKAVAPGVTTENLDVLAHDACLARGVYPSPLNYHGYPKSICTSVNEVICHGIPDDRALLDGDIVNIDVTVFTGVHGDTNATFAVGTIDEESRRLIEVTRECLERAIALVRPGARLHEIGRAIQTHAEGNGYGVVRGFVGHGIGEQFHIPPTVLHYYDPSADLVLAPGMTFTIEPMITMGDWRHRMWDDDWTAVTADHKRTAQFEHTILVTDGGAEILTTCP